MSPNDASNGAGDAALSEETLAGMRLANAPPGEEVCITGCAGIFPESDNVHEFRDNLLHKVDMVVSDHGRWNMVHPELPLRMGKINHVGKFDASFFGYHHKQANLVDPMSRILLEKTYEALVDAGVNPSDLRGTRTGVFIGACSSEMESEVASDLTQPSVYSMIGGSRAAFANRISYWLRVNGPSYTVDSACSSSLYAIEHAYRAIRDGQCDQAIVGGANLCLHPYVTLQFSRIGVLSPQGMCKSFDAHANGYVRSEAANVMFLQKAKDAKRVYASFVYAKTNCDGYKEQGITYPSGTVQRRLLRDFYRECQVDPASVAWVEAHGTGTGVGDPEECNAIGDVMCKGRSTPLPIGSVKSNIGHSEPASGLCSITKVILAMETGLIPPNLHYTAPRAGVKSLADGTVQVVTEPLPWKGGTAAISSFGFGGANCHVLLKWNPKTKINGGAPRDKIPRLVTLSSRTEQGLKQIMDDLESRPVDVELVRLYHDVHAKEVLTHKYRGYTLLVPGKQIRDIKYYEDTKARPVWLLLSGVDNRWGGLAKSLIALPAFSGAIERCQRALSPTGLDLGKILGQSSLDQSCVGVTAVQIGLIDVLTTVGVRPDGIIGNYVGELAAAYADNCLTTEQTIMVAYYQGLALKKMKNKEVIRIDSNGVKIKDDEDTFTSKLTFTSEPQLLKQLQTVIPVAKLASSAWISSSLPASQWDGVASAEYFAYSLTRPPLFREALSHVPRDAVVVEVAANADVKEALCSRDRRFLALTGGERDVMENLLIQLGNLYECGLHLRLADLYPEVSFPVSRTTPMISPHIGWDHDKEWFVAYYESKPVSKSGERYVKIVLKSKDCEFYRGHVIDGRNLFPATGYLALAWETIGLMNHSSFQEFSVVFENVRFHRATNLPKEGVVDFVVMVQKSTGHFEINEGGSVVVSGSVFIREDVEKEMVNLEVPATQTADRIELTARDIYKELNLRGYNYSGLFRSLLSAGSKGDIGKIHWMDNWIAFMDNMLQMQILGEDTRGLFVPTSIDKLCINSQKHLAMVQNLEASGGECVFDVFVQREVGIIKSGGIEVRGLSASAISRRKPLGEPVLEKYQFLPNTNDRPIKDAVLDLSEIMRVCVQVALENTQIVEVKCVELADSAADLKKRLLATEMAQVLGDMPLIRPAISVFSKPDNPLTVDLPAGIRVEDKGLDSEQSCHFVLGTNILSRQKVLQSALVCVGTAGFIITREPADRQTNQLPGIHILNEYTIGDERIMLIKKGVVVADPLVIRIADGNMSWLPRLQAALKRQKSAQPVLLVAQGEMTSGLLGLFTCIRREPGSDTARCFFILDPSAPAFDASLPMYAQQIAKDVAMNVYQDGVWGSYRHLLLENSALVDVQHAFANIGTRGDLSSFQWFEGPLVATNKSSLLSTQELVQVYYSALNFRDVMTATGKLAAEVVAKGRLNQECVQGLEFSGRDSAGKRVMGMISSGAMSTMVEADKELLWEIPDSWTLEDAATVPVVYGTAFYALVMSGRMERGDTILIHAGSGGVGQAAINIALHAGCTVFTTVGTQEKREFIKQRFPQLTDRHIGNSRDTSFEQLIMAETDGRGVDLLLNSLSEEKLQASLRCLAVGGRFLEIGKFDLAANNTLGMNVFLKETSFHGIMLDNLFFASSEAKRPLFDILNKGIRDGAVRPLTRTVFRDEEVEQAFRFMAAGKHIGKVLLRMRPEESKKIIVPQTLLKKASPRFFCNPKHTYIIAGGLGGFGLELADWCVLRGARRIVLTSRTGVKSGYQAARIATWRSYGATIHVALHDIATEQGVKALLQEANRMGPVAAIFNLAVVLADAFFENQTEESFKKSSLPKSEATRHLDVLSRRLCPQLQHFVVFSSVSCGRGNAGQTNYGMSNSVMERICEKRVKEGYPGLAVQWGAVGDVGLVADMQEVQQEMVIGGTLQQRISSCLHVLDQFLRQPHPVVSSMVVAEKRSGSGGSGNIVDSVVNILGIKDLKTVSLQLTLAELGMDSMMAVEIKQTLERDFEVFLSPPEMRALSFAKLIELSKQAAERLHEPDAVASQLHEDAFQFLVRAIGDEEAVSTPFTLLPSLTSSSSSQLFLIPGIEGMATVLEPLAKNLKAKTIGFQLGYRAEKLLETTLEMAKALLPHVKNSLVAHAPFNLLGYSFGGLVALDLAKLLEDEGHYGQLFLLDGAPDFIQGLCKSQLREGTEDNIQINLLIVILNIIKKLPVSVVEAIRDEMTNLPSWKERVDLFVTKFPETKLSEQFIAYQAHSTYARIRSVLNHSWPLNAKLKSAVTLIRPTYLSIQSEKDHGLSKYCVNSVDVHFVEGDHVTILASSEVADIINKTMNTAERLNTIAE